MKKSETAKLLAIAAEFDRQPVTPERVEAWHVVIGDLDYSTASEALRRHFRESDRWLMPAHIVDGVTALRQEAAWAPPALSPAEQRLCEVSGVPEAEFAARRDDEEWIAHLRSRWMGIER